MRFIFYNRKLYNISGKILQVCSVMLPALLLLRFFDQFVLTFWIILCIASFCIGVFIYKKLVEVIVPGEKLSESEPFIGRIKSKLTLAKSGIICSSPLRTFLCIYWTINKLILRLMIFAIGFCLLMASILIGVRSAMKVSRAVSGVGNFFIDSVDSMLRLNKKDRAGWKWVRCNEPVYIRPLEEANPHINISGASGYGKSTLCKILLQEIVSKLELPVLVLDVHNEYSEIVAQVGGRVISPKDVSLNMWELDGISPRERIGANMGIFRRIMDLGDMQAYYLGVAAENAYKRRGITEEHEGTPPSMQDITEECKILIHGSTSSAKRSIAGLMHRLEALNMTNVFSGKTTIPFKTIVTRPSCFELADLKNTEAQAMFIEIFLKKLYTYMVSNGITRDINLYVLIDEAHRVCISNSGGMSHAGTIASEARKYGIGLITSNQMAKDLDRAIVGNSATTFVFCQREPSELSYSLRVLSCGSDNDRLNKVQEALRNLQVFQCIMISSRTRDPVLIEVKPTWKRKEPDGILLDDPATHRPESERVSGQDLCDFIRGELSYGGVQRMDELYGKFNAQREEINEAVARLFHDHIVEINRLRNFNDKMEMWVVIKNPSKSLEHNVYVRLLAEFLEANNIGWTIFDRANTPDLEMEFDGETIALEYETGSKWNDEKIKKMLENRLKKYNKVIVITPPRQKERYLDICSGLDVVVMDTVEVKDRLVNKEELDSD